MAGSLSWKKYVRDNGDIFAVKIDEGNAEAADFDDITVADEVAGVVPPPLPKSVKMRYANVRDPSSGSNRKIYVGKPDSGIMTGSVVSLLLWAFTANNAISAISWIITSVIGETFKESIPNSSDTGFLDGDAS